MIQWKVKKQRLNHLPSGEEDRALIIEKDTSQDLNNLYSNSQELPAWTHKFILLGGEKMTQSKKKSWNKK